MGTNYIESLQTLTGYRLSDAFSELDRKLDNRAYKPIRGGKGEKLGFTDLDPTYLYELLNELFGPLGVGWTFDVWDMKTEAIIVEGKERTRTDYMASCMVNVQYSYVATDENEPRWSRIFMAPGGSTNSQPEWAAKGAVTNALGGAWYFAGYQHTVYKGLRSHTNVAKETAKPQALPVGRDPEEDAMDGIVAMETAKSMEELKKIYGGLRGTAHRPSVLWQHISAETQGKIEEAKEEAKKALSSEAGRS